MTNHVLLMEEAKFVPQHWGRNGEREAVAWDHEANEVAC